MVGKGPGSAHNKKSSSTTQPEVTVTASTRPKGAATSSSSSSDLDLLAAAAASKDEVQILNVTPARKFFNGQERSHSITLMSSDNILLDSQSVSIEVSLLDCFSHLVLGQPLKPVFLLMINKQKVLLIPRPSRRRRRSPSSSARRRSGRYLPSRPRPPRWDRGRLCRLPTSRPPRFRS